jgi:hypothetical protein
MSRALILAAGCVFCLSQQGLADEQIFTVSIQFSKPNVTYDAFVQDRDRCLASSSFVHWSSGTITPGMGGSWAVPGGRVYNFPRFGNCMLAKGYKPDPNGFFAAKFRHRRSNEYTLMRS